MMSWEKARYQGRKSEDVDVTKERLRVESNNDPVTSKRDEEKREDVVIIKHLTKFYNWKKVIFIHDAVLFRNLYKTWILIVHALLYKILLTGRCR